MPETQRLLPSSPLFSSLTSSLWTGTLKQRGKCTITWVSLITHFFFDKSFLSPKWKSKFNGTNYFTPINKVLYMLTNIKVYTYTSDANMIFWCFEHFSPGPLGRCSHRPASCSRLQSLPSWLRLSVSAVCTRATYMQTQCQSLCSYCLQSFRAPQTWKLILDPTSCYLTTTICLR